MSTDASFTKSPVAYPSVWRRVVRNSIPWLSALLGHVALASADDVPRTRHATLVSASVDESSARLVLEALDRARGSNVRIVGSASAPLPNGELDVVATVENSRFEACVGRHHPTDRASFHVAREACAEDRGLETTVYRLRVVRDSGGAVRDVRITSAAPIEPSEPDTTDDDHDDYDDESGRIEERSRSVAVASVALVDVDHDGSLESIVQTVETIESVEQLELDEETRGESVDEAIDLVTYVLRLDVIRESGSIASSIPVISSIVAAPIRAPVAVSIERRNRLAVERACITATERGCRGGRVVSRVAAPAPAPAARRTTRD